MIKILHIGNMNENKLNSDKIKNLIIRHIGISIDEDCVCGIENSFIEMDYDVIHYTGDGGTHYFKMVLIKTDESEYDKNQEILWIDK